MPDTSKSFLNGFGCSVSWLLLFTAVALLEACHNGKPTPVPPAPQAALPSRPHIESFAVDPPTISPGQMAVLRWSVSDANNLQIDQEVGEVEPTGKRTVSPAATTTYKLTAKNAGGIAEASITLTIANSVSDGSKTPGGAGSGSVEVIAQNLRDVHFQYNEDVILPDEQLVLSKDASILKSMFASDPNITITIEGHCDERGSPEYNVALADRRANFVKDSLVKLGIPDEHLNVVSYGDQRPLCVEATEECYSRNRRAHFAFSR